MAAEKLSKDIEFCIPSRKTKNEDVFLQTFLNNASPRVSGEAVDSVDGPSRRRQTVTGILPDLSILNQSTSSDEDDAAFRTRSASIPINPCMDGNRKHWLKKIRNMKLETTKKGGFMVRRSSSQDCMTRRIKVDFKLNTNSGNFRRKSSCCDIYEDPEHISTDNNISRYLILNELKDGVFSAELPLTNIPKGELRLLVSNNKLTLIVTRRSLISDKQEKKNRFVTPYAVGYVEMPIYVDATTLQFQLQADNEDILLIRGVMKGMMDRCGKVSTSPESASTIRERTHSFDISSRDPQEIAKLRQTFRDRCHTR